MSELSFEAKNINWLVNNFVDRTPGVSDAMVVTSDGLPMAISRDLDRASADRFAAVASGLIGLAYGAAGRFGGGAVNEVIVEKRPAPVSSEKGKPARETGGSERSTAPRERRAPERPT